MFREKLCGGRFWCGWGHGCLTAGRLGGRYGFDWRGLDRDAVVLGVPTGVEERLVGGEEYWGPVGGADRED